MKKVISIFLALTVIICLLSLSVPAYAASKSIKSVVTSSKTWCDVGRENGGNTTEYKFTKNNKVTIINSDLAQTVKKTVKYKISKNKITFTYNMYSYKYKSTISMIDGSNLLKITTTSDDIKYVTLLDKGSFKQRSNTKVMKNFEDSSWKAPSLKKKFSSSENLVVDPADGTDINAYFDTSEDYIEFYGVTNTVNTIKLQNYDYQDVYIIEKTSSPNKMKIFIFKNGSNKYTTETWTKVK